MVVDLSVDREDAAAALVDEGLGAVREVDDGEPLVADHRMCVGIDATPVRAAVAQSLDVGDGLFSKLYGVSLYVENGEDSTHAEAPRIGIAAV